jgi:hypothetical protein
MDRDKVSNLYTQAILFSGWLISKKSSPLKPHDQLNRNLVGSIYGRSSIKNANFIPICLQTWLPCLLTDRDEVSVQLVKQFQGRRFLEMDQSERNE